MKKSVVAEMKVIFEVPVREPMDEMSLMEAAYKIDDGVAKSVTLIFESMTGEKTLVRVKDWNTNLIGLHDDYGNLVS